MNYVRVWILCTSRDLFCPSTFLESPKYFGQFFPGFWTFLAFVDELDFYMAVPNRHLDTGSLVERYWGVIPLIKLIMGTWCSNNNNKTGEKCPWLKDISWAWNVLKKLNSLSWEFGEEADLNSLKPTYNFHSSSINVPYLTELTLESS